MSECSCWMKYPNPMHKKDNGKWKCVNDYECIQDLKISETKIGFSVVKRKTHCRRKEGKEMIRQCLVCGKPYDTTITGRYRYCSEKCLKSRNNNNFPMNLNDLSSLRNDKPMQVELEGDGYSDGELVYDYGKCPNCGWEFEEGDKDWEEPYWCHCGQKLHWFEYRKE